MTLLEASERAGGRIRIVPFAGVELDVGPDALLTRAPGGVELCRELGLGDDLVPLLATAARSSGRAARCARCPPACWPGLPAGPGELLRSRILSPAGVGARGPRPRAARRRARGRRGDRRARAPAPGRAGARAADRPAARRHQRRALRRAERRRRGAVSRRPRRARTAASSAACARPFRRRRRAPTRPPMFLSLRGGLETLVDALAGELADADCASSTAVARRRARRPTGSSSCSTPASASTPTASSSRPRPRAPPTSSARAAPAAAGELDGDPHRLGRARRARLPPRRASPRSPAPASSSRATSDLEHHGLHLGDREVAAPRRRAPRTRSSSARSAAPARTPSSIAPDDELIARARRALAADDGPRARRPADTLVVRHRDAFPQYAVGHLDRVARIEAGLATALPGPRRRRQRYRGVGVPSCITSGRAAARAPARRVDRRAPRNRSRPSGAEQPMSTSSEGHHYTVYAAYQAPAARAGRPPATRRRARRRRPR